MNSKMKQTIASFVILLLVAGGIYWKYFSGSSSGGGGGSDSTVAMTTPDYSSADGTAIGSNNTTFAVSRTSGNSSVQLPEPPQNGVLKGVVEVGASGFNSFVVRMDQQKRWEIVSKDFGESLTYEGLATVDDIMTGLKRYLAQMLNKGVSARNLHFVISSGALKEPKTKDISAAIRKMGYVVNEVTAEQEGKFALLCVLPPNYRNDSYVVDIGSGNTKISWYNGSQLKSVEASGAKYFQMGIKDTDVESELQQKVSAVPHEKRKNCFIIGGVPFMLAKQTREGKERYTTLKDPDEYNPKDDVKMKSGLHIYRGLIAGSGTENFVFDWDANFTIGFLLSLK